MTVFKSIIDQHPNPCVVHINFVPLYANDAFAEFSGFAKASDVLSLPSLKALFVEEHWPEAQKRYQEVMNQGGPSEPIVVEHTDINGLPKLAEITDSVLDWYGDKAICTFISVVTDRVHRERQLKELALRDELTGIMNRRYLVDRMNGHHRPYREHHHYLALIDLDYFKQVNDTFGHLMGDELLKAVAHTLSTAINSHHKVSRIGGEEFAMVISAYDKGDLCKQVTHIQNKIAEVQFEDQSSIGVARSMISCTASIGVSGYQLGDDFNRWFSRADKALYEAKHKGRNTIVFDDEVMKAANLSN